MITKTMKKNHREFWADAIRAISIFMVVIIHSSAKVLYEWDSTITGDLSLWAWNFTNVLNSFSRISVPLFVMLSGAFLLSKNESLVVFLKKRLSTIILPWILWGTVQLFYNYNFSISEILNHNFATKIAATYMGGFWFMPMILGLYLITPFIKPFVKNASNKEFLYFFSLWFVFVSVISTLNQTFEKDFSFQLPVFIQYLGYFVAGYFLVYKAKLTKLKQNQIKLLFFVGTTVIALGTYAFTQLNNQFHVSLYEYINIFVVTTSITGFVSMKSFFQTTKLFKSRKIRLKITKISEMSLGIFLCHALILDILTKGKLGITMHATIANPFLALPVTILLVFFLSVIVNLGLQQIQKYKS